MRHLFPFFLLIILVLSIFTIGFAGADYVVDVNSSDISNMDRVGVIDSNGVLYAIYEDSLNDITMNRSYDNGVTWSYVCTIASGTYLFDSACIDGNNRIHIVYHVTGGDGFYVNWTNATGLSGYTLIVDPLGDGTKSMSVTADEDNNIYVGYAYETTNEYVAVKRWDATLSSWTSGTTLSTGASAYPKNSLSMASYENNVALAFHSYDAASGNKYIVIVSTYNPSTETWSTATISNTAYNSYSPSVGYDSDGNLHVAYEGTNAYTNNFKAIYHAKLSYGYSNVASNWNSECVYYDRTHDFSSSSISINTNNRVNIVFSGITNVSSNSQILYKTYLTSWSALGYLTTNSNTKSYPALINQYEPYWCRLEGSGISFIYYNSTGTDIMYGTDGDIIWYSGGASGGTTPISACGDNTIGGFTITEGTGYLPMCPYLYTIVNVKNTMTVSRVDLQVSANMYDSGVSASSYKLKYNQYDCGGATEWIYISSDTYILSWQDLALEISNNLSHLCFYATTPFYYMPVTNIPIYWQVHQTSTDNNGDGMTFYCLGTSAFDSLWSNFNTNYIGILPSTLMGISGLNLITNHDPIIRICIAYSTPADTIEYANTLVVEPSTVQQYETVKISFLLNDTASLLSTKIYVISPGTDDTTYYIFDKSGQRYFTPLTLGKYYVNITINNVNTTYTSFTVSGTPTDYIYSTPNPSNIGSSFTIYYKYSGTSYRGAVRIRNMCTDEVISTTFIDTSSEDSMVQSINIEGAYILQLCAHYKNSSFTVVKTNTHVVGVSYPNSIDGMKLSTGTFNFYGMHNFAGQDVFIKIGQVYIPVGCRHVYDYTWNPTLSGTYTVYLILRTSTQEIKLASTTVTIGSSATVDTGLGAGVFNDLPDTWKVLIGVIITTIFFFLPAILVGSTGGYASEVPGLVYAMSGGIGMVLSVGFGFFALWVPFFFVVIAIVITILYYMRGGG